MQRIHIPSFNPNLIDEEDNDNDDSKVVETDPSSRFERYNKCLGMGAYKKVYLAYDQEEGVEVAWNELRLDHIQKKDVSKILSEVQILQQIRHESIINLYHSWMTKRNGRDQVFFITELMTSGTLKSYIRKTKGPIKTKVIKNWCRQILRGLDYLHSKKPPIIHRDLKCDNIFINGNTAQVKIGDLGLATFKDRKFVSSVLGTPEFMAPELYEEKYDEKADIYSFGMCLLEMATKEYPYCECSNQAQIYRKVTSKIKPKGLEKIIDVDLKDFINLCIEFESLKRPSACDLLEHPFLQDMRGNLSSFPQELNLSDVCKPRFDENAFRSQPSSVLASPISSSFSFKPPNTVWSPSVPKDILYSTRYVDEDKNNFSPGNSSFNSSGPVPLSSNRSSYCLSSDIASLDITGSSIISLDIVKVEIPVLTIKMLCLSPKSASGSGKQEVKFPFHLKDDTVADVVDEMIKEGVLQENDRNTGIEKINSLVMSFLTKQFSPVPSEETGVRSRSRSLNVFGSHGLKSNLSLPLGQDQPLYRLRRRSSMTSINRLKEHDNLNGFPQILVTSPVSPIDSSAVEALHRKQKKESEQLAKQHAEEWLSVLTEQHNGLDGPHDESQIPNQMIAKVPSEVIKEQNLEKSDQRSLIIPDVFWTWSHEAQLAFLSNFLAENREEVEQLMQKRPPTPTRLQHIRKSHSRMNSAPNAASIMIPPKIVHPSVSTPVSPSEDVRK